MPSLALASECLNKKTGTRVQMNKSSTKSRTLVANCNDEKKEEEKTNKQAKNKTKQSMPTLLKGSKACQAQKNCTIRRVALG